jgi:UDP-N-acetylmuramoyl-L-alanyl-D-glutamate--2,6-diaminopimelate ligase
MRSLKKFIRDSTPSPLISAYHFSLAYLGALLYGLPSRKLIVIGVTGTDGKSSTTEYINAIFEAAGYTTALSNSIRVKIAATSAPSTGRSMPGRFFIQRFFRRAIRARCAVAIVEMTSEGVRQHRHRAIELNALVFTNLSPEHIESHGSFQAYADAKFEIGRALAASSKRPRIIVANGEDPQSERYLALPVEKSYAFSLSKQKPWNADERGGAFTFCGVQIRVKLGGQFYIKNALAAAEIAHAFDIDPAVIRKGIESITRIPGRMDRIDAGQEFSVIVDYALTPEALEALYKTFDTSKKICVFGCTGGGRDTWKRPVLGKLAETYCDTVIVTNDIAYDESPEKIADDIVRGMSTKPEIVLDRRAAIRHALELAQSHADRAQVAVLITGMGIDTELSTPDGKKVPWNDVDVAREEITALLTKV